MATAIVFSHIVSVDGAPWVRLHFDDVRMGGSAASGKRTVLRITSLEDGATQVLDSDGLRRWRHTSAYFNGDQVLVELLVSPDTGAARVVIDAVTLVLPRAAKRSFWQAYAATTIAFRKTIRGRPASCPSDVRPSCSITTRMDC